MNIIFLLIGLITVILLAKSFDLTEIEFGAVVAAYATLMANIIAAQTAKDRIQARSEGEGFWETVLLILVPAVTTLTIGLFLIVLIVSGQLSEYVEFLRQIWNNQTSFTPTGFTSFTSFCQ